MKAAQRELVETDGGYALREPAEAYTGLFAGRNDALSEENHILWDKNPDHSGR